VIAVDGGEKFHDEVVVHAEDGHGAADGRGNGGVGQAALAQNVAQARLEQGLVFADGGDGGQGVGLREKSARRAMGPGIPFGNGPWVACLGGSQATFSGRRVVSADDVVDDGAEVAVLCQTASWRSAPVPSFRISWM